MVLLNLKIISENYQHHLKSIADFECILKIVKSDEKQVVLIQKIIKITLLAVLRINLSVLIINSASQLFFTAEKMQLIILLRWFMKSCCMKSYCKKIMKKHFLTKIWSWLKNKKKIFDQVTHAGYVKKWLMMKK